jgi:molybdate transport system substrate-binding protein
MAVLASALLWSEVAAAAEVRVLSVGAVQYALKAIAADYAKVSGDEVVFTIGSPAIVMDKLKAGETSDVLVMSAAAMDAFEPTGGLRAGSRRKLGRTGIGVAVRDGAPVPDLASADAFKRAMLGAHSIAFGDPSIPNQSGAVAAAILESAGILDQLKSKIRYEGLVPGQQSIANGEIELGLFNVSEIKSAKLAGPVPAPLQRYTPYDAAVTAKAAAPDRAQSFVAFMSGPAAQQRWREAGFEAPAGGSAGK